MHCEQACVSKADSLRAMTAAPALFWPAPVKTLYKMPDRHDAARTGFFQTEIWGLYIFKKVPGVCSRKAKRIELRFEPW